MAALGPAMGAPANSCKAARLLGRTGRQWCTGSLKGLGGGRAPVNWDGLYGTITHVQRLQLSISHN